ncbi:MAG: hypothetical protein GC158_09695 [Cyanobacteria bacterium RI_101]|nr:hypothetical protein [Cyanobacteria bacterium RI_101]
MTNIQLANETWEALSALAEQRHLSIPDFLEKITQGQLAVIDIEELEDLMDAQDVILAESDPENGEAIPWEQAKRELGF